jgi:hypothetical protein
MGSAVALRHRTLSPRECSVRVGFPTGARDGRLAPESAGHAEAVNPQKIAEVLSRPLSRELLTRGFTRLAYVAEDGTPRVVPIGFVWNGSAVVVCTPKNAPKLAHLRRDPAVALTIDTEEFPPKILLLRGTAELDAVEGIPDEYFAANNADLMPPERRTAWEAEVRSLYAAGMVRIVVTPTWAKLIDFDTTLPSAVEELIRQREERREA